MSPFADFDYVAALPQTAPVPQAKDTGSNYQLHPQSTGTIIPEITEIPYCPWCDKEIDVACVT